MPKKEWEPVLNSKVGKLKRSCSNHDFHCPVMPCFCVNVYKRSIGLAACNTGNLIPWFLLVCLCLPNHNLLIYTAMQTVIMIYNGEMTNDGFYMFLMQECSILPNKKTAP